MSHEKRCDDSRASAKILMSFRFENESSTGTGPFFFVAKPATTQNRKLAWELYINGKQSSQVDLLAKSEMLDGAAVVCDAKGVTPLGGSGGMLPQKILKN